MTSQRTRRRACTCGVVLAVTARVVWPFTTPLPIAQVSPRQPRVTTSRLWSTPQAVAPARLSILELLKATIGLHNGPWGLPISNTSVVRLLTAREVWNETEPWRRYPVGFKRPTSTAFAVDLSPFLKGSSGEAERRGVDDGAKNRYLITADHVLASHFRITASHPGLLAGVGGRERDVEFRARVLCRSTEWDLALLTVDDDEFWEDVQPLPLSTEVTCKPDSLVTVAGYYNRSLTTHEWMVQGYAAGTDCVNLDLYRPGSAWERSTMPFGCSGGPILAQCRTGDYSVIGMLSAGEPDRPILHTVPAHLIQRFVQQYQAIGQFSAGCRPGFKYQTLLSPFLRERLGLGASGHGVLITQVAAWMDMEQDMPLRTGDVLMEVDGMAVCEDGRVTLPEPKLQVPVDGLWDLKGDGDSIAFKVMRGGKVVVLQGTARQGRQVVPLSSPSGSYAFVGGLLFLPASQTKVTAAQDRVDRGPVETQALLRTEHREFEDEEYILLWRIYPHEVNTGYQERLSRLVSFNGERVRSMAHFHELLQASRENAREEWLEFVMDDAEQKSIVLPAFQTWMADEAIRKANRIPPVRPRVDASTVEAAEADGDESDLEDDLILS